MYQATVGDNISSNDRLQLQPVPVLTIASKPRSDISESICLDVLCAFLETGPRKTKFRGEKSVSAVLIILPVKQVLEIERNFQEGCKS